MSTTIEQLELEILSSSQSATSGLTALKKSLEDLKTATSGGLGLTSVAKNIGKIKGSAKEISANDVTNVNGLARAINLLGGTKISSTVGKQITAISTALNGADFSGSDAKLRGLADALTHLSNMPKTNLTSYVNSINKLPEALEKIDTRALYTKIQSITRILKPFADEMQKVANGFSVFPTKIQRLVTDTNNLATTNKKASLSYTDLYSKIRMAAASVKTIASGVASGMTKMMSYIENVNLFTVSMGKYTDAAGAYAEKVGEILGIDPGEWMRNQGIFMTLATGFGIAGDRASLMSEQLTQLGYDISSFFNISVEDAMQKLQSGFSGELEPLRRLGYDLSQAKLAEVALSLGIDKKVASMTQAEKAQLRYYAIMTQVTSAQGDMARTLDEPANQMRIFKAQVEQAARAIGSIFIPVLNMILPYAIAVAKVIRILANELASLFGFELPEVKFDGIDSVVTGAEDTSEAFDNATASAKKLKSYMLGFDELNVLDPNAGGGSGENNTSVGSGLDFKLPTYDFLKDATETRVSEIVDEMKEWLGITDDIDSWSELMDTRLGSILVTVGAIGVSIAAWKVAKALLTAIDTIQNMKVPNIGAAFSVVGLSAFLGDLDKLKQFVDDMAENGANFSNVSGILSEFAGLVGDAMIILGQTKTASALKAVQGVGEIASAISSMVTDGVNITNVTDFVRGLSNLGIAIGLMTGNFKVTGVSLTLQGITTIIQELGENWDAIKNGDWSGVSTATVVIGVIEAIGGILTALGVLSDVKKLKDAKDATKSIKTVTDVTKDLSTSTSTMTTKLKGLTKNLGLGLAAVAEVSAAAILIVGTIWVLGVELDNVGKAWTPVIENAGTVATAMGVGTGLLVAVGVLANALGKSGKTMVINIGVGTAILLEIGVATGLFLAEIWAIGKLLDKVGNAWKPVIDDGETIKTAIVTGTAILVAVGAVTALLGVAATATGTLLPIAIGLGTALLLELGVAAGVFITEIWAIGKGLDKVGKAWKPVIDDGKTIETAISTGTGLLIAIGVVTAALGVASVATVGLLPVAIKLGTDMLEDISDALLTFIDCLCDVADKLTDDLSPELTDLNDVLPDLKDDMTDFTVFMGLFAAEIVAYTASNAIAGIAATIDKVIDFFTTDPIKRLSDEVSEQYDQMVDLIDDLKKTIPKVEDATSLLKDYNDAMDALEKEAGTEQSSGVLGFVLEFAVNVKNTANEWWSNVKKWWGEKVGSVQDFTANVKNQASTWWSNVKSWWNGSSGSVDVKVNATKGWSGTIKSALGIGDKLDLSFGLPKIKVKWGEKTVLGFKISYPSGFETYAKGGFPDVGQMFVAREAGPELVGNIGNRNAVVNNDQIVESVSTGVYQAVVAALGSGSDEGGSTQIVVNLDGEKIYENQQKIARNRGYNLGMGAFSFG